MDNNTDKERDKEGDKGEASTAHKPRTHNEHKPGILKKSREPARKKRIVWDEDNIAFTESQKSSTMKIDEPKTPYHYYDSSEDDEEKTATRARALEAAVGKMVPFPDSHEPLSPMAPHNFPLIPQPASSDDSESSGKESGVDWAESDESGKDEDSTETRKEFNDKRRQHYNEYEMMKKLRENLKLKMKTQQNEEEEEDEMEGDERSEDQGPHTNKTVTTTTTTSTTPSENYTEPHDDELPHKSNHPRNHNHHHHHPSSNSHETPTISSTSTTGDTMDDSD